MLGLAADAAASGESARGAGALGHVRLRLAAPVHRRAHQAPHAPPYHASAVQGLGVPLRPDASPRPVHGQLQ
eukprot:5519192-Lingulodinium_polyedra.AAC.1